MMIALGATAIIAGPDGERRVPMGDFFLGYRKTALVGDEILLAVEIPHVSSDAFFSTYKVSKRREMDISICAAGMLVQCDEDGLVEQVCLAYGGMAATPLRARTVEAALVGKPWREDTIEGVLPLFEHDFEPISDHRASAQYRRLLAKNLLRGFYFDSLKREEGLEFRPCATVAER